MKCFLSLTTELLILKCFNIWFCFMTFILVLKNLPSNNMVRLTICLIFWILKYNFSIFRKKKFIIFIKTRLIYDFNEMFWIFYEEKLLASLNHMSLGKIMKYLVITDLWNLKWYEGESAGVNMQTIFTEADFPLGIKIRENLKVSTRASKKKSKNV